MLINGMVTPEDSDLYKVSDVFMCDHVTSHHMGTSPSLAAIKASPQVKKIPHHIANQFGQWTPSNVQPHGRVKLTAAQSTSALQQLNLQPLNHCRQTEIQALADTGSHTCIADWSVVTRMNIKKADLLTPALTVYVADNANLELMGSLFMTLTTATGQETEQLVYFARGVGEFYLSKAALIDLEVISPNFPTVGGNKSNSMMGNINEVNDGFPSVHVKDNQLNHE